MKAGLYRSGARLTTSSKHCYRVRLFTCTCSIAVILLCGWTSPPLHQARIEAFIWQDLPESVNIEDRRATPTKPGPMSINDMMTLGLRPTLHGAAYSDSALARALGIDDIKRPRGF